MFARITSRSGAAIAVAALVAIASIGASTRASETSMSGSVPASGTAALVSGGTGQENAVSREVSVFVPQAGDLADAVSREVSVFATPDEAKPNAVSREVSIFTSLADALANAISREVSVSVPPPNLTAFGFNAPGSATRAETIQVSWSVSNQGTVKAQAPWVDRVVLTVNDIVGDSDDTILASITTSTDLEAGANYQRTTPVSIPVNAPLGAMKLGVIADGAYQVFEFDGENDNAQLCAIQITQQPLPDVVVASLLAPPIAKDGDTINLVAHLTNQGSLPAGGASTLIQVRALMSPDPVLSPTGGPNDIQLATPIFPLDLAPGASTTLLVAVTIPPGIAGNYWFGVDVDITNNLGPEASKTNNFGTTAAPTLVEQPNKPDLRLTAGSWKVENDPLLAKQLEPDYAGIFYVGTAPRITFKIQNGSSLGTASGSWSDRLYISADGSFDPATDTLLFEKRRTGALQPGKDYLVAGLANALPEVPGIYTLFLVTDGDDEVDESDDSNNVASMLLPVDEPLWRASIATAYVDGVAATQADGSVAIALSGQALDKVTGQPVPNVPITYRVRHKETRRVFAVVTDAVGSWSDAYFPLPAEAGRFELYADHPAVDEELVVDVQDDFVLFGASLNPQSKTLTLLTSVPQSLQVSLQNLGDTPIGPITPTVSGVPAYLTVGATPSSVTLAPKGQPGAVGSFTIDFVATDDAPTLDTKADVVVDFEVSVQGGTGLVARALLPTYVSPLYPELEATPNLLASTMLLGGQTVLTFEVKNVGLAPATDVQVTLPEIPNPVDPSDGEAPVALLANLLTDSNLGDIGPDESRVVEIALLPSLQIPVGAAFAHQNGSTDPTKQPIRITGAEPQAQTSVGYYWEATTDAKGAVTVSVQDEATYWSLSGSSLDPQGGAVGPLVPNATVRLTKPVPGDTTLVFEESTGASGSPAVFDDLPVGTYQMTVSAAGHGSAATIVKVDAGDSKDVAVFIPTQGVSYEWTVVPTEIVDEYDITITATFETTVPVPVVTITPGVIELDLAPGEETQIDLLVENQGFIAVQNVSLISSAIPGFTLQPLIQDIGEMAAKTSITIPVLVERDAPAAIGTSATVNCTPNAVWGVEYSIECGGTQWYWTPLYYQYPTDLCGGSVGGGVVGGGAIAGGGAPPPNYTPVYTVEVVCEAPPIQTLVPPLCAPSGCDSCDPVVASGPPAAGTPVNSSGPMSGPPPPVALPPTSATLVVDDDSDPVLLFSGELVLSESDLRIKSRGMDLEWRRYYRSRRGWDSAMGQNWDHGFNVWIDRVGPDVRLYEGAGRDDLYSPQPNGTWTRSETFRIIERDSTGRYTVTFADGARWEFFALDGSPAQGMLDRSIDRNGNVVQLLYDGQGRLKGVLDTLNRPLSIVYDAAGYIESVVDFSGRAVHYEHDAFGNLASVTSPAVIGVPNDLGPSDHVNYPQGLTRTYTYSSGFAIGALNHNLLTATDARGITYLVNVYNPTQDVTNRQFDRVVSQQWGDPGEITNFYYLPLVPSNANGQVVMKTIVNDRMGNVVEYDFDLRNRLRRMREYTGRAPDADSETTLVTNRPGTPLRANEPIYYETRYGYDLDSLATFVEHPDGTRTEYVYEQDLDPNAPRRAQGNLRSIVMKRGTRPFTGEPDQLVHIFEYQPNTGGCCGATWLTKYVDPAGRITQHQYDAAGNRTKTIHPIPEITEEWTYNQWGQMLSHTWPSTTDDAAGYRQRDEYQYYTGGPSRGYLQSFVRDAAGFGYVTQFEYDLRGNVTRRVDPRGSDYISKYDQRDLLVQEQSPVVAPQVSGAGQAVRYRREFVYDENGNALREEIENRGRTGDLDGAHPVITTTRSFGTLDELLSEFKQVSATESAETRYEYDANRNVSAIVSPLAVSGLQPGNRVVFDFDTRDRPLSITEAPGTAVSKVTRFDHDAVGNLLTVVEGVGDSAARVRSYEYDAYQRSIVEIDPMGNVTIREFDLASNIVVERLEGELVDIEGSAQNIRLAENRQVFDDLNRVVTLREAWFDPATQQSLGDGWRDTSTVWSHRSRPLSQTNDRGHATTYEYDGAGRARTVIDARGNRATMDHDGNDNLVAVTEVDKSDLGAPDETFVTTNAYDALDRLVSETDNIGGVMRWHYDSRGNRVFQVDRLGNEIEWTHDARNLQLLTRRFMTDSGVGGGQPLAPIVTRNAWDLNGRLVAQTDDNGNETRYDLAERGWIEEVLHPDATSEVYSRNALGEIIGRIDPNGTVLGMTWDRLGRMRERRVVSTGAGVGGGTFSDSFDYDGRGNLVAAVGTVGRNDLAYDSLTNLVRESQLGRLLEASVDALGNLTALQIEGGSLLGRSYDSLDRPTALTLDGAPVATYRYRGRERVEALEYANGVTQTSTYDSQRRKLSAVATLAGATIHDRQYTWDAMSMQRSESSSVLGWTREYGLDSTYRLTSETRTVAGAPPVTDTWTLDGVGNRTQQSIGGVFGAYVLDPTTREPADYQVNQYTSTPYDNRKYSRAGEIHSRSPAGAAGSGADSFVFDGLGRLVQAVQGSQGQVSLYEYDARGRRVREVMNSGGSLTNVGCLYWHWQLVERTVDGVAHTHVVGRDLDSCLAVKAPAETILLVVDELSSPELVMTTGGTVSDSAEYSPFGTPISPLDLHSERGGVFGLAFLGLPWDEASALLSVRAREYDPRIGRFVSSDPMGQWFDGEAVGSGTQYAGGNPISMTDRSGLAACCAAGSNELQPWVTLSLSGDFAWALKPLGGRLASNGHFGVEGSMAVNLSTGEVCFLGTICDPIGDIAGVGAVGSIGGGVTLARVACSEGLLGVSEGAQVFGAVGPYGMGGRMTQSVDDSGRVSSIGVPLMHPMIGWSNGLGAIASRARCEVVKMKCYWGGK
jgi:RHS repeat-associated protein